MASPTITPDRLAKADQAGEQVVTPTCHTAALIGSLPVNAQASLYAALTTTTVKTVDIVRVLNQHGLPARAENVGRHRRRLNGGQNACKCPLLSEATP